MRLRALLLLLLFCCSSVMAQRLSPLATAPDWSRLEAFQETMTAGEFRALLEKVYAPGDAAAGVIEVRESEAVIFKRLTPPETMILRFAKEAAPAKEIARWWRPAASLGPAPAGKPLAGVRIALDPGHIGGEWAAMEERHFRAGEEKPVREGDMTLLVAQLAAPQLRALGAEVSLVRDAAKPASPFGVDALRAPARDELRLLGVADARENYEGPRDPLKMNTVQGQAERLFYRVAEIRERARRVNRTLRPDLAVCIHFNADDWSDPENPVFTERNDLHLLVNGCYSAGELRFDDQRFEMLLRLLGRTHREELAASAPVASALAAATGLPAFQYTSGAAVKAGGNDFLWARNLLANRLFECPVIFLEPYRMNHAETYARIQAGDYEGTREVAGTMRPSIFREYADALVAGLRAYFSTARQADSVPK